MNLKIDRNAALTHLRTLGYTDGDMVYLRSIHSTQNKANKAKARFPNLPWKNLEYQQRQGFSIYFVVNGGGHEDAQVEHGRIVFYEHDDLDKDLQQQLWQDVGLPEPTIQIDTGGKSIHSYWKLDPEVSIDEWRKLQTALLTYAQADPSIKNPSRVMRLAGCWHMGTKQQSQIVSNSGTAYAYDAIWQVCSPPEPEPSPEPEPQYRTPEAIPLYNCLSREDRSLIDRGIAEGGRNSNGARLARALIGTENWLRAENVRFDGNARELFDLYCSRCSPALDEKEAEQIWRSAEKKNPTPTLSREYLQGCITAWERKNGQALRSAEGTAPGSAELPDKQTPIQLDDSDSIPRLVREYWLLKDSLGDRIRLNTLTKEIELDGKSLDLDRVKLDLAIDHAVYLKSSKEETADIVVKLAEQNQYSPLVEYLESVHRKHGDDTSILDNLALRYFGQSFPIYNTFAVRTLIAAVARAYQPGCKHDCALILQGNQGFYKSTWFKTLAGQDWFDDTMGGVSDKDERLKLHQVWWVEWAELETIFGRKDVSSVKAFLSSSTDRVRPPYGRTIQQMPRHSIIVGTTNKDEFLSDPTGNRRFWVIPVLKQIDTALLEQERDRIWAAAVALYKRGEKWHLTHDEAGQAAAIAQEFHTRDPWHDLISGYISDREFVTTRSILSELLQVEPGRQEKGQQMRITDILKELGWRKGLKDTDQGARQRVWLPPDPPDPPRSTPITEVDLLPMPVGTAVSAITDPPDPPSPPNLTKTFDSPNEPLFTTFSKLGGSGGSGGSDVDKSRLFSDPPLEMGGSGGSKNGNGNGNGYRPKLDSPQVKAGDRVKYKGVDRLLVNVCGDRVLQVESVEGEIATCSYSSWYVSRLIPIRALRRVT